MKKLIFVLAAIAFVSCEHEETPVAEGSFTISVSGAKSSSDGRTSGGETPATVLIDLVSKSGKQVFTNEKISLTPFGNSYLVEARKLPVGIYSLTSLVVLNSNGVAIYATPRVGSPLAGMVNTPLPFEFEVKAEEVSNHTIEVVRVSDPELFGYSYLFIKVVKRLLTKNIYQFVDSVGAFVQVSKDIYKFEGKLLKEINSFETYKGGLYPLRRQTFNYDSTGRLSSIKDQVNVNYNYFHVKEFSYAPGDVKIAMYEMSDKVKFPEYITHRITTPGGIQLVNDYRTVDYGIASGNLITEKLSDRSLTGELVYDNAVNPEYFFDAVSELSYVTEEIGSKNNVVKKIVRDGNSETVLKTISITYDADKYPLTKIIEYSQGGKFKYVYEYQ